MKKRTLNELRQTKDSYYQHDDTPVSNSINYLCSLYPNNADLGREIRKLYQKFI